MRTRITCSYALTFHQKSDYYTSTESRLQKNSCVNGDARNVQRQCSTYAWPSMASQAWSVKGGGRRTPKACCVYRSSSSLTLLPGPKRKERTIAGEKTAWINDRAEHLLQVI